MLVADAANTGITIIKESLENETFEKWEETQERMSRAIRSCLLGVGLLCLSLAVGRADEETKPPPPAGMTQQQYDELVKSVGQSVLQTLTEKGLLAKPSAPPSEAKLVEVDKETLVAKRVRRSLRPDSEGPWRVSRGLDGSGRFCRIGLDRSAGGRTRSMGLFSACSPSRRAAAVLAEVGIGRLTLPKRTVIARQFAATGDLWRVVALALLDGLAFVALWIVAHLALDALFAKTGAQTQFAAIVLRGLLTWRMFLLLFRLFLRPDMAAVRIAPVSDESALRLFGYTGLPCWPRSSRGTGSAF